MAKRIDTSNLTVDFKQLMRMTVQDRIGFFQTGGASYFESLTPTQLAQLFPKFYQRQLPDIGKVVSGGTAGTAPSATPAPTTGGGVTSGALGRAARSQAAPGQPQGQSTTAQRNAFLEHLESITGKRGQQTFASSTGFGIDRSRFKAELENNPELAKRLMSLAKAEVGSQGIAAQQKWMETVFNRAYAQGKSISAVIDPNNGYWPRGQKRPQLSDAETETYMGTLNRVLSGSNESNYATDNASAGLARRREQSGRKGSWEAGEFFYTDFHYRKAMERLRQETEQRAATSVQKPEEQAPSQSGMPSGLRPESPVPGRQQPISDKDRADFYSNLYARGARIGGVSSNFDSFQGLCGKGARGLAGALLNDSHFSKGLGVGGSANAGSLATNNNYLQMSGLYNERQQISAEQIKSREYLDSLPIGTVIASHNDGRGPGHVQIKVGPGQWVSDKRQGNKILERGRGGTFTGFAVITPNQSGIQRLDPRIANDPSTVAWAAQQGYSLNEQQQQIAAQQPSTAPTLPLPSDFNTWNPKLQEYFKSLPTSVQQNILKQNEHLKEQGKNINDVYEAAIKNGVIPNKAVQETVTAVTNAPPGELPATITDTDLQGAQITAEPYSRVVTNISGYSPGSQRPKAAGPGTVQSTTEELNILKRGIDDRGPSLGYHAAVASFYHNKETGQKIDETAFNKLSKTEQQNYVEKAEVHQLRNPSKRVSSMGGVNPTTGKPWNADTYAVVRVGKMSPEKIRAYEEHLAEKYARGEIPEVAIRNIYGDGALRPEKRGHLEKSTGGEGVADASHINKGRIFARSEEIKKQMQQAASRALPTQTGTPPTQVLQQEQSPPMQVSPGTPTGLRPPAPAPAAPQAQPAPAPAAPQAQPQATAEPAASTATPVQEAPPRQEDQVKPNAVGGQEQTTENIGFYDTNTGKTLGTAQPGEVVALNQSGIAEIKPEQRISEIPELRSDMPQHQNISHQQEQTLPEQPTNMAAMTSTPNVSIPDAHEIFGDVARSSESKNFYDNPSNQRAMDQYNFRRGNVKYGFDTGFNTLFG